MEEEVSTLKHELQKSQKEIYTLQKRIASVGSVQGSRVRGQSQLEEENTLLRQQVSLRATVEHFLFGLHHVLVCLVLLGVCQV